ncbi:MAG: chlorite dismutase family protein [Candidatus Nanopelagicales bacterium]|nr:chlorite dismutase family protein [Candidatus Nanopelagicales bacterium]
MAEAPKARDINAQIRYTMWSVFRVDRTQVATNLTAATSELVEQAAAALDRGAEDDVVVRGWYDVAGLRGDADVMLWLHAPTSDALQDAYHAILKTDFGSVLEPVWSQMALHRPAEFNKSHVPAFMADERAHSYVCVYPFVRSYEWYLLPDEERRELLVEHGMMGREYPDVRANTVASFALGDYEWILAFEADDLDRIVDLMRHLRASRARMHVREEIPFYTGRRRELGDFIGDLR